MNATDELRGFANSGMSAMECSAYSDKLIAIADRIDAEHEESIQREHESAYDLGYVEGMGVANKADMRAEYLRGKNDGYDEGWDAAAKTMTEHMVELPKDADGEYIHIGERVQLIGNDQSTVSHMSLADDGWRVYVKYDGGIGTGSGEPKRIRHYHAQTVEDVLREFAEAMNENMGMYTGEAIDADEWRMADERTIAKYAAKLRLAEEDA